MNFEWYNPKTEPLKVSIGNYGITFYNETIEAMGSPKFIQLGFNAENKIIGVNVCENINSNCLEFISKKQQSYVRINNKNFIRFIESKTGNYFNKKNNSSKKYEAFWDENDKTLYVFLEKPLN